jgi:hypothetical protein
MTFSFPNLNFTFSILNFGLFWKGKSALINHLVKLPCKKSTPAQFDTTYTIVEVVSEDVFRRWMNSLFLNICFPSFWEKINVFFSCAKQLCETEEFAFTIHSSRIIDASSWH